MKFSCKLVYEWDKKNYAKPPYASGYKKGIVKFRGLNVLFQSSGGYINFQSMFKGGIWTYSISKHWGNIDRLEHVALLDVTCDAWL